MKVMYVFKRKFHYFWGKNLIKKKKKITEKQEQNGVFYIFKALAAQKKKMKYVWLYYSLMKHTGKYGHFS